ncbi:cupin domain-containing protein [Amycolatopsis sp. NPDC098790]|uniref:AraC family transcriptional regulator n=1 Tax=Amycolatopsis sp. NPDC098790 TaxID=3363939 RepID=UPI00382A66C5
MDILQDHLARTRASGGVFARSVVQPPWGLRLPGTIQLSLHTVVQGRAWIWLDDPRAAMEVVPGDLCLIRGGPEHHVAHTPDPAACQPHEEFLRRHPSDERSDDRAATVFLCGAYRFAGDVGRSLIDALPPTLLLHAAAHDPLHDVIGFLSRELGAPAAGHQTVLDRLLDVLLVMAMRAAYDQSPTAPRWYRAGGDPRLGPALHAIHAQAEHPWTVPELASLSGMSRPAFARNFERSLGQAPMQYLTDWRMTLARDHLRGEELTLDQIARRTGYTSPNAFAAAFRRHHGVPPGHWRQEELSSDPSRR